MGKSNAFSNDWLRLIFNAVAIANIADNAGTDPIEDIFIALHTASPGDDGSQSTNEVAYTGYSRVGVPRTSDEWTVSGNEVENAEEIAFGECSSGTPVASHFSIGVGASGATKILYHAALTQNLNISPGITPRFQPGDLVVTES